MERDLDKIEGDVVKIRKFTIQKRHLTELARGTAGAFIGISIGMGLRWVPIFAAQIEWINAIAILIFIMGLGAVLLFKAEGEWIAKEGNIYVAKRLGQLFGISTFVIILAMFMFNMVPDTPEMFVKTVVVGLYPAMSGAITFTIT